MDPSDISNAAVRRVVEALHSPTHPLFQMWHALWQFRRLVGDTEGAWRENHESCILLLNGPTRKALWSAMDAAEDWRLEALAAAPAPEPEPAEVEEARRELRAAAVAWRDADEELCREAWCPSRREVCHRATNRLRTSVDNLLAAERRAGKGE